MAETSTKATPKKAATKKAAAEPIVASTKPEAKKPAAASAKPTSNEPVVVETPAAAKSAKAKPATKTTVSSKVTIVSDEQRYRMIAEAAYYHAERNQFKSDHVRDWIDAERDIAALLSGGK